MENLNDLLTRGNAAQNFFAQGFFFDARDETFRDLKINVGFKQSESDLAQRTVDVGFANRAMAAQVLENVLQLVAELRKHIELGGSSAPAPNINLALSAHYFWHRGRHGATPDPRSSFLRRWRRRCGGCRRSLFDPEGPMGLDFFASGFGA